MKIPRYLHNIYCDDIRTEHNFKSILIGVYGHDMLLQTDSEGPITQHICIRSYACTPIDQKIEKITYLLRLNGQVVHTSQAIANPDAKLDPSIPYAMHETTVNVNLTLDKNSVLCMCAQIDDDEEIAGPELRITIERITPPAAEQAPEQATA